MQYVRMFKDALSLRMHTLTKNALATCLPHDDILETQSQLTKTSRLNVLLYNHHLRQHSKEIGTISHSKNPFR